MYLVIDKIGIIDAQCLACRPTAASLLLQAFSIPWHSSLDSRLLSLVTVASKFHGRAMVF